MSRRAWQETKEGLSGVIRETVKFQLRPKTHRTGEELEPEEAAPKEEDPHNKHVGKTKYEYKPLTDRTSIRLLELLPGAPQDDIACSLHESRIDDCRGSYEALSYVWGDQTKVTSVRIGKGTLTVTENLGAALRALRKPDLPRTLWADAMCIDQANLLERNHQVGVMDEIYRSASRTVIWLGPSVKDKTDKAYDMLDELAAEAISREHSANLNSLSGNLTLSLLDRKLVDSVLYERYQGESAILHLAEAAWWSRAWTVQEILLASQAVVVTGSRSMEWKRLCTGVDYGFAIGIFTTLVIDQIVDPTVIPYFSMRALTQIRKQPSDALSIQGSNIPVPAQDMLRTLIHCRFRQSTDPRDKVYALLRLQITDRNHTSLGLEPDYAAPTSIVYSETARQLLLRSNSLDLLGACTPSPMDGLPSWAPDWSSSSRVPRPLMDDAFGSPRQTHASARTHPSPRFLDDGGTLLLSGHELTTITALTNPLHRLQIEMSAFALPGQAGDTLSSRLAKLGRAFSNLAELYNQLSAVVPQVGTFTDWEAFARSSPPQNPCPPVGEGEGYDPLAVYWRTLCAGAEAAGGGQEETARLFYAWRANLRPLARFHEWCVDRALRPVVFLGYLRRTWRGYSEFARLIEMVYERRLGRGGNGLLALVPDGAEVGDRIVVVKGGRVLLVLRRDGSGQGYYRLVGEAYVEGIMDGEAFDEGMCVEMRIR
ncbi:heterokaryon incompatibility protein-domain-containing protein [Chaetomium sp. MPI-CAGE-AT-0009]|nr:heterokaryon incompatibility protein-domain-containing protein [Chaetomium sp. MPI-CAGE-AT-0009]